MQAFFFSVFLGFTGADYFYLGYPLWGVTKLGTLGGCGFWWLLDIVRTGAGPVYAHSFRTANDLPHWVAVLIMVFLCMFTGFMAAIQNYLSYRRKKRLDLAILQSKEEARNWKNTEEELKGIEGPRFRTKGVPNFEGRPGFCGYGATMPIPLASAGCTLATTKVINPEAPPHQRLCKTQGDGASQLGWRGVPSGVPSHFGPAGVPGRGSPTPGSIGYAGPTHAGLTRDGMVRQQENELYAMPGQA